MELKKYLSLIFYLLITSTSYSQEIEFNATSLQQVLSQASDNDLIFIQIYGATCQRCDEIVLEALNTEPLKELYSEAILIKKDKIKVFSYYFEFVTFYN